MAGEFKKGAIVWVKQDKYGLVDAIVTEVISANDVEVTLLDGPDTHKSFLVSTHPESSRILDEQSVIGVDDMINLPELFNGSLLRNLRIRHKADNIYTYTGTILVAVNPYKPVPLYGPEIVTKYSNAKFGALPPHIFAIADDAYRSIISDRPHKSILISGESGAGKTESTKLIINYLTYQSGEHTSVEQFLLESSPILESFGNATTSINNNSSRFGKFVEIFFTNTGKIVGGKVTEYLLEKSRIVRQPSKDRNYHVFYSLLRGATPEEKTKLNLSQPELYNYLKNGNTKSVPGIDDVKAFKELRFALSIVGFGQTQQLEIFSVIAFILHLGNIVIGQDEKNNQKSAVKITKELEASANLIGVSAEDLVKAITLQSFKTGRDTIARDQTPVQAEATRDSIAKSLYGILFRYIVDAINTAMSLKKSKLEIQSDDIDSAKDEIGEGMCSVGILDIFGFEVMELNSFEQFCINMANETLQAYFNNHIFKMEQEEYEREGIIWEMIPYTDNEDCIQLLYRKKLSLMNLLDEECFFPSANDDTLMNKFNDNNKDTPIYAIEKNSKSRLFTISHYAAKVQYSVTGFLDKNIDILNEFVVDMMVNSQMTLVKTWYEREREIAKEKQTMKRGLSKQTVGGQFKDSLSLLMTRLEMTDPYFVRCIKPNMNKAPNNFERDIVLTQLQYTGMIETVKIRSLGYTLRMTFKEFYLRYFPIKVQQRSTETLRKQCENITNCLTLNQKDYQIGKTMIFMRNGPKRALEIKRHDIMVNSAVKIAYFGKMIVARARYERVREAVIVFQKWYRCARAVKSYRKKRLAIIQIQKIARGWRARMRYGAFLVALQLINAALRARACRHSLVAKKDTYDKYMREESERKARMREEEALEEKRRKEAEEAQRAVEEKKRLAQLDNPGFTILGLAQELNNEQYDMLASYDLPPPQMAVFADSNVNGVDLATQYSFAKYISLYLRPGVTVTHSAEPVAAGLHIKLAPAEDPSAVVLDKSIRAFVDLCEVTTVNGNMQLIMGMEVQFKRKQQVDLIWETCRGSPRLIDELYCLIVKHTTMNGSKESVWAGWYLMALMLGNIAPSENLYPYLLVYIIRRGPVGFASHCQRLLLRVMQTGSRKRPPCSMEYESAAKRTAVLLEVLPGPHTIAVDSLVLGDELTHILAPINQLPISEGCGVTVNERVVPAKGHVLDIISMLEEKGVNCLLLFRRHSFLPSHQRDMDPVNRFVVDQINNDVFAGMVDVSMEDALKVAVLRFIGNGGERAKIPSLDFDPKSIDCVLSPALATMKDTKTWIKDFTAQYDVFLVEDSHTETAFRRLIALAETWSLYFGHTFSARQKDGTPVANADEQLFLLVNINGIFAFKYTNNKRVLLAHYDYEMLTAFSSTSTSIQLTVIGGKSCSYDTHSNEFKSYAYTYLLHLKDNATYCIATHSHSVHDPMLLEFAMGSVIRLLRHEDTPEGWFKGEVNDESGLFPKDRVELLIGSEPPTSKEAILFQATLAHAEDGKGSELVSVLNGKQLSKLPRSPSMQLDERHTLIEFAKKYMNQPKRTKATMKNRLSGIASSSPPGSPTLKRTGSISLGSGKRRFGSISFPKEENVLVNVMAMQVIGTPSGGFSSEDLSFSPEPLKAPLLSSVSSKRNIKLACALSQGIMRAMGDYPSKKDWIEHAIAVIEEGIHTEDLRDELYCQLMKQLLSNARKESVEHGWWLMSLCLTSFSPSERLFPYLRQFLIHWQPAVQSNDNIFQSLAETSADLLDRTRVNGTRVHPPTALEFDCLMNKKPIALRVFFPDQSSRSFMLDGATTAAEMIRKVSNKLDSYSDVWAGCGLYLISDSQSLEMCVPTKMHIFDSMTEAHISASNCRLLFKKKLWFAKDDTSSQGHNNLVYHQVLPLVLKGWIRCPVTDPFERVQDVAFLAALQYKASGDDQSKARDYGDQFKQYIPEYLYTTHSKEEWTQTTLSAYATLLSGKSQADAKAIFIDTVRKWPHYGSTFFQVKQTFEPKFPENLIMAVSSKGIALLHETTKETLHMFKLSIIASWYFGAKYFSLKVDDLHSGDKYIFYTNSGAEITDLIEDYISALIDQRKKAQTLAQQPKDSPRSPRHDITGF